MAAVGGVVLPGDAILVDRSTKKTILGPGLRQDGDLVLATKAGVVKMNEIDVYWVESHQKRYVPARNENVIGLVMMKAGDTFKVDIGSSEQASLSYLSFDGATKRNRPDVRVGDLVYAKLVAADKHVEPELVCIDSKGRSNGLGVLRDGGHLIKTTLNFARKLLSTGTPLLRNLGKPLPYEICVGMNGWIWVKGRSIKETLALANALSNAEHCSDEQVNAMVKKLANSLAGF